MKRPLGVKIFGVLFILGGLYGLLSFALMAGFARSPGVPPHIQEQLRNSMRFSEQMIMLASSVCSLAAGIGLLMLKRWAWVLTLILAGISAGANVINLVILFGRLGTQKEAVAQVAGQPSIQTMLIIAMVVTGLVLSWNGFLAWYFLRSPIKAVFRKAPVGR